MRLTRYCALACALLAVDLAAQSGARGTAARKVELRHFRAERMTIPLEELRSEELDCLVYLPIGLEARPTEGEPKRYPWALWLPGLNDSYLRFHHEGGAEVLDELRGKGEIPELILIVPTVARQTMYMDGESYGQVETALTEGLRAYVEETWRVRPERGCRAVMGVSMGGFAALKFVMRYPESFGVVATHSAAILPANPVEVPERYQRQREQMIRWLQIDKLFGDPIDQDKWAAQMPLALVRNHDAKRFAGLSIYFDAGTEDRMGFGLSNQELHRAMERKDIAHVFRLVEGGGHSWRSKSMRDNLRYSLRFVGEAFDEAMKPPISDEKIEIDGADEVPGVEDRPIEGSEGAEGSEGSE